MIDFLLECVKTFAMSSLGSVVVLTAIVGAATLVNWTSDWWDNDE